ncbi:MAG: metallophosphoesterase family protein [Gemmatimonadota bacterium]
MRLLHLADVHLDTPFLGRSETLRERLREASRDAFRRAVDLAVEEKVHAVLLAGDLFDGERLSFATERFLLDELRRLSEAGIQTVYATGNHDPGEPGRRALSLDWPGSVAVVAGGEPTRIDIRDDEGRIVGRVTAAGHETARETRDLVASFPAPGSSVPEVGLVHAQVVGARAGEVHDPYAPTEVGTLRRSGYDYWALGHVHARQRVADDPPAWYPGNLQGRNPRETGDKGGLLVELGDGHPPRVEFRSLAPVRWETLAVDGLEDLRTLETLARAVEIRWRVERKEDPGLPGTEWAARFDLRGPSPLHRELAHEENLATLEREVAARLDLLDAEVRAEEIHAPIDPEPHRRRQDVLGEALRMLEEARTDDDLLEEMKPEILAGRVPGEDESDYLRTLLEGLDGELVSRMIVSDREEGGA